MSIFTKDCPVCAASHPVHVVRCGCGHCFDPNKLDGVTQELEVIAQEERLYRDYLAARADQADKEWRSAKVAAAVDPGNTVKAAEALLAEQHALSTRAELDSQDARAHAVSARIKVVRTNRRNRRQAKAAAAPRSTPLPSLREVVAPPRPNKSAAKIAAPAPVTAPKVQTAQNQAPAKKPAPPVAKPVPRQELKQNVVVSATPPARKVPQPAAPKLAAPVQVKAKPAAPTPAPPRSPSSVVTTPMTPPPSISQPVAKAVVTPAPAIASAPTPAFRATQATKAAQVVEPPRPASQECPNCSAKLPLNVKRCRCGYELPVSASQIPSLSMSAEDRAALLAALAPLGTDKS